MKRKLMLLLVINLLALNTSAFGAEQSGLKVFPPAKEGMERFVIVLPHKKQGEEDASRVELIVGKEMLTDGVNQVRLDGTIGPRSLKGWGYTYYEITGSLAAMSTMMADPQGATPMVKKFVTAAPIQVRYNSRLPIVVYVPKGYEVRYRIWRASETTNKAEKR